jgi:putative ABC transport system ATP-binding protein
LTDPAAVLELKEVAKHYQAGDELVRAVDGVSLSVGRGELVALYGPSGSGKSTLLMLAAAILSPDRGSVRFEGRDIAGLSDRGAALYRRRELGLIFQAFHLVPGLSALDNATMKLLGDGVSRARARKEVRPLLELVGLIAQADRPPARLSAGERQRVAIARALAGRPSLILADEPTGNLDTERGDQILALLKSACQQRAVAVILVTHDPRAVEYADRVHALRDGRLTQAPIHRAAAVPAAPPPRGPTGRQA